MRKGLIPTNQSCIHSNGMGCDHHVKVTQVDAFSLQRYAKSPVTLSHILPLKVRKELEWQDAVNLDQGLDECIAWVKKYFDVLSTQEHNYIHKA